MSILKVDTINEKTSGNGVQIAGHVVQVQQFYNSNASHSTSASASFVASGIAKSITPKYSNSLIIIQSNVTMSYSSGYSHIRMYLNGSAMTGSNLYHVGYIDLSHNAYGALSFQAQHQATSTAALNFEIYYASPTGTAYITHAGASAALTLWEIAQ